MDLFQQNDSFVSNCSLNQTSNMDNLRFGINGVAGAVIAMLSVANNSLLFYVFLQSQKLRRQNYANPMLLALFDAIVSLCHIGTICISSFAYHYQSTGLVYAWIAYVRELYCFQHICITICNFLLVVASLERFCANALEGRQKSFLMVTVKNKGAVVALIVFLSTILKGTFYFETAIADFPGCGEINRYAPVVGQATQFSTIRFITRKTLTVIIPFFIILYCNSQIVSAHRAKHRDAKKASMRAASICEDNTTSSGCLRPNYTEKKGVRTATRTLMLVMGCYLISNTTSTIVNFAEFFDPKWLEDNFYIYLLVQDASCLLTIVGCFCRLPIYCLSDRRIRKAVTRAVIRMTHNKKRALEMPPGNLEKWSFVVVSNSLRSNLTAANHMFTSQEWFTGSVKRTKDELAFLLHSRRRLLVDMTLRMGSLANERLVEESTTVEGDYLSEDSVATQHTMLHGVNERTPCLRRVKEEEEEMEEMSDSEEEDSEEGPIPLEDDSYSAADVKIQIDPPPEDKSASGSWAEALARV